MSFNTALSGLNAAQSDLDVTSNNIANVNTTGFKESRAEFGDIYANSAFGSSQTSIGSGVLLTKVAQQFNQGNLEFTSNTLDFAISGEGFFVLSPNQEGQNLLFSRSGAFGVNSDGFVVNSSGQYLRTFPVNDNGTVTSTSISSTRPLQLPDSAGSPSATTEVDLGINLPANANIVTTAGFDPNTPSTYSASTSVSVYDSLGETHIGTAYYSKIAANTWATFLYVDGNPIDIAGGTASGGAAPDYATLGFDTVGNFTGTTPATITSDPLGFTNGSDPTQTLTLDYANNNPTQFASPFTVNTLNQDGFPIGRLTGLDIGDTGTVRANYTNGQSIALGKIALSRFPNAQGLSQEGNTSWTETINSGEALAGEAGTSSFGLIRAGALETSNVDLTAELVDLITAQRNFQANARSIETSNSITQTIVQIR